MVRIPGSHPGGPGSIPGVGKNIFVSFHQRLSSSSSCLKVPYFLLKILGLRVWRALAVSNQPGYIMFLKPHIKVVDRSISVRSLPLLIIFHIITPTHNHKPIIHIGICIHPSKYTWKTLKELACVELWLWTCELFDRTIVHMCWETKQKIFPAYCWLKYVCDKHAWQNVWISIFIFNVLCWVSS